MRNVRIAVALLSSAVTVVGLLWWMSPASYPFGARDRVTVSLSHLIEHDVAGPMTVVAGLAGLALSFTSGRVLRAGAVAQALFFGVVLSDAGIMSLLGYGMALLGPVALVAGLVMAGLRGRPWGFPALGALLVLAVGGALSGVISLGGFAANVVASFGSYAGRLAWTLADAVACAVWVATAVAAFGTGRPMRWTRPEAVARWGRVATIGAALCPLPYALYRLTWLTPWPTDVDPAVLDMAPGLRAQGLALAFAGVGGAVLTLGLVSGWGEVWPRWVPVVHDRPVPVRLPVTTGGLIAGACCLSSPGLVVNTVEDGNPVILLLWPYPLWGVLLGAAVFAYWLRRRRPFAGAPETAGLRR